MTVIQTAPIYAAIDLGSNSFHMLIVREVNDSIQTIGKIKRKVRLAAGLDDEMKLSDEAMARGWDCLSLFAERLQDIPTNQVRVVGTATLRLAKNVDAFLTKAEQVLGQPINIISGNEEAEQIYIGVAHTSGTATKKLIIDIGGASTELVAGEKFSPKVVNSFDIGCVTYLKKFFADGHIDQTKFDAAIGSAQAVIQEKVALYTAHGWDACLGASGTPQAVQECLIAQGHDEIINLARLEMLMEQAISCGTIEQLDLIGLAEERKPVFVSGLAILIAMFRSLNIGYLVLAGGALREGLIYGMIAHLQQQDVRARTTHSFIQRYQLDATHAENVKATALKLFSQLNNQNPHWNLAQHEGQAVLEAAALLHEVGFSVDFKYANKHGAYILNNTAIPGFSLSQRKLLIALVANFRDDIDPKVVESQTMTSPVLAAQLTFILRLAILLNMRRKDEVRPDVKITVDSAEQLKLSFMPEWLKQHPLMAEELKQESQHLKQLGLTLVFS
ncbi:guanosine-5'-triphosphate,3'-diphosphate diphosphatase [Catenovulum sp. SM1970]|uniref:guanosine-5'-triphosphate,3'-diphosphate diphosphatase n=1 Tax=Marinifaba aquimaris TaxID=2741323 RepID=UPI0015740682|nr:guanosine-5'-triphosphate,3'-diphosphate diphosphatase [Marinifaba aquimaris]NTS76544.1 guanosine-5'-triphosphate,3'-diphosphate diphosphatase [Marinifaba aquimaris]